MIYIIQARYKTRYFPPFFSITCGMGHYLKEALPVCHLQGAAHDIDVTSAVVRVVITPLFSKNKQMCEVPRVLILYFLHFFDISENSYSNIHGRIIKCKLELEKARIKVN